MGEATDYPHRRQQDPGESGLEVTSFDHADIAAEIGTTNKRLKVEVFGWIGWSNGRTERRH